MGNGNGQQEEVGDQTAARPLVGNSCSVREVDGVEELATAMEEVLNSDLSAACVQSRLFSGNNASNQDRRSNIGIRYSLGGHMPRNTLQRN